MELSSLFPAAIRLQGWSQRRLASELDLNPSTIQRFCANPMQNLERLRLVCDALGIRFYILHTGLALIIPKTDGEPVELAAKFPPSNPE